MRMITIGDETYRAIVADAIPPFSQAGVRQPDGKWQIALEDDTWRALQHLRLRSETDDDALRRIQRRHNAGANPGGRGARRYPLRWP